MQIEFRNDTRNQYAVIAPQQAETAEGDYRLNMITLNRIAGFAKCRIEQLNGNNLFYYDITGKTRLAAYLEANPADSRFFKKLFSSMASAMESLQEYLLGVDGILLDTELLFADTNDGRPCFIYYPYGEKKFAEGCRVLSKELLNFIKQDDIEAVKSGYGFYRNAVTGKINADTLRDMAAGRDWSAAPHKKEIKEAAPAKNKNKAAEYDNYKKDETSEAYSFLFEKDGGKKDGGGIFKRLWKVKEKKAKYQADGISQSWLVNEKSVPRSCIKLDKKKYIIGQKIAGADISLSSKAVSRAHAKIMLDKGRYYITDLSSKNGTQINGVPVESGKKIELKNGDRIQFADVPCVYKQQSY